MNKKIKYNGPKFPPLNINEIEEKYNETCEEMKEVLKWKAEEKKKLNDEKATPQKTSAAKRSLKKVARRIDTVNGNLVYWKLRKEGKSHFHASVERAEYWDKLKNSDSDED